MPTKFSFLANSYIMDYPLETDSLSFVLRLLFHWIGNVIFIVGKNEQSHLQGSVFSTKQNPSDAA